MDPIKIYDYLTRARDHVFNWVRPLSAAQYTQEFPNWNTSLARTLTHVLVSEYYYVSRIAAADVPPYEEWPIQQDDPPAFPALEAAWRKQATDTQAKLDAVRDWTTPLEFVVEREDGNQVVNASPGDLMTQLAFHEMHHRAQVINMLKQLEAPIHNLDYGLLTFFRRDA